MDWTRRTILAAGAAAAATATHPYAVAMVCAMLAPVKRDSFFPLEV